MKFSAAILMRDGHVTANERRDSDDLRRDTVSRDLTAEFAQLLRENLSDGPEGTGAFLAACGGGRRYRLHWQQVEPLSALGTFFVHGRIAAVSLFLYGFVPEMDTAVLKATDALFVELFADAYNPSGLRAVTERPAVIAVPRREGLTPKDWRIIGNLCPCLAAAFFDRAAAFVDKVEADWHNHGFRKGGKETAFLNN